MYLKYPCNPMLFVIEMLFICGKVSGKFAELLNNISLHLVELSPTLSDIQERTLTAGSHKDKKNEKQCGATRSMYAMFDWWLLHVHGGV